MSTLSRFCTACGLPLTEAGRCPNGHEQGVLAGRVAVALPVPPPEPAGPGVRFCIHCGAALDGGQCPQGHFQPTDAKTGPAGGTPSLPRNSLSVTLATTWRLLQTQPRVLWLPVEAAAVGAAWGLGFALLVAVAGVIARAHAGAGGPFPTGYPGAFGAPSFGGAGLLLLLGRVPLVGRLVAPLALGGSAIRVALVWMVVGLVCFVPYAAGGTMAGLMRALDDRVRPMAFWSDGLRFFGRSYLAAIAVVLVGVVPALVAGVWGLLLFRLGHVVGPVLGILGDLVVGVLAMPLVGLVGIGVYQSGWEGTRRTVAVVRGRWFLTVVLLIVVSLIGGVASWIGAALALVPVLGWIVTSLLTAAAWTFSTSALLVHYRAAVDIPLGAWYTAFPVVGSAATLSGADDTPPASTPGAGGTWGVAGSPTSLGGFADVKWSPVEALMPRWGALLRSQVQEVIPAFLGAPAPTFDVLEGVLLPREALAIPVDSFALFGALLGGLGRPFWGWVVGGLVGFIFGVLWTHVLAYAVRAGLVGDRNPPSVEGLLRSVSVTFLIPLVFAAGDVILAPLARSFYLATLLCYGSLLGTWPFTAGLFQSRGVRGWRSALLGAGVVALGFLPWLGIVHGLVRLR